MTRWLVPLLLLLSTACKEGPGSRAEDIAESCGDQECPVGTAFAEYREIRSGFELGVGLDPKSYSGEVAFQNFGEGSCTYTCETINACPDGTFPVISADCFTCGAVTDDGEVAQGDCGDGTADADLP